ncbi:MAG: helix-turn-helix domain-containing protein [Planctomycetes bacterium]|nr:helix-turn-helix domain-containing protein [Planctomycetota bacterium]
MLRGSRRHNPACRTLREARGGTGDHDRRRNGHHCCSSLRVHRRRRHRGRHGARAGFLRAVRHPRGACADHQRSHGLAHGGTGLNLELGIAQRFRDGLTGPRITEDGDDAPSPRQSGVFQRDTGNASRAPAADIAAAKERGVHRGRRAGTYKAAPTRAGELLAKGLTTAQIAQALGVSRATVSRYLHACA